MVRNAAALVFFLFHSQAFFNYYYLSAYLFLLALAQTREVPNEPEA